MKIERIKINDIPSMLWGEKSNKVFISVHGNMSNKEEQSRIFMQSAKLCERLKVNYKICKG